MAVIEKIDIKDFQQYSSAEDADCMLMVKKDGTGGRMTLVLLRGQIGSDVKPTIREGIWWIGNLNTNIPAEGLTPEFRSNALGIEWKYVKEPAASWRMLAGYETLKLKFSDLTVAQKRELIPHLKDFTPEEIAELQKPATDAITRVTATETEVKRVEALRVTAESARVAEENKRASAENTRATEEGKRVSAESSRKTEYSQIITDTNKAKNDAIAETAKTVKAISDTNTAIAGAKKGEDNANAAALKVDTSTATLNATETEVKRVEALRVTEENKRVAEENKRASAENTRATEEGKRVSAETARVTEENKRTVAESARVTEETKRATSENTRATEEGKRATEEKSRAAEETKRASAESNRVTSASSIVLEESKRAAEEVKRVDAEKSRVIEQTQAIAKVKASTDGADAAALRANNAAKAAEGIVSGVRPDWMIADKTNPNYIANKPEIPTISAEPAPDTLAYTNKDGKLVSYSIGDELRVVVGEDIDFYKLYAINAGKAVWDLSGGASIKQNIYLTGADHNTANVIKQGILI